MPPTLFALGAKLTRGASRAWVNNSENDRERTSYIEGALAGLFCFRRFAR